MTGWGGPLRKGRKPVAVQGWLNYHAVPGNSHGIGRFVDEVIRLWLQVLQRRSQRGRRGWT